MTAMKYSLRSFVLSFFLPLFAMANVAITEIMYDLDGADAGREWIEIYNAGSDPVDLSGWKFYEADSNHSLTLFQGDEMLFSGSYAIIASDPSKFIIDHPAFFGAIFKSSFSLLNTGESLAIRDSELNDIDTVSYTSDWGANGDGKSLQKLVADWIAGVPTPSAENVFPDANDTESVEKSASSDSGFSDYVPPENLPSIKAIAGSDKTVIAGAEAVFSGDAYGLLDEPLPNARFLWSFGDGSRKEGREVIHTYHFPGDYRVVLDVSSGAYTSSSYLKVTAVPNDLYISEVKPGFSSFIEIHNPSHETIDISGWLLRGVNEFFSFPENTAILPQTRLAFPEEITHIAPSLIKGEVELLYQGGGVADQFLYYSVLQAGESFHKIKKDDQQTFVSQNSPGKESTQPKQHVPPASSSNANAVNSADSLSADIINSTYHTNPINIMNPIKNTPQSDNFGVEHSSESQLVATNTKNIVANVTESSVGGIGKWFLLSLAIGLLSAIGFILSKKFLIQ